MIGMARLATSATDTQTASEPDDQPDNQPRQAHMSMTSDPWSLADKAQSSSRWAAQGSWRSLGKLARAAVKEGRSRVPAQPRPSTSSMAHGSPDDP